MKIVQVPMDECEAEELMALARRLKTSRADLVRTACRSYVAHLQRMQLDEEYERGYREVPEAPHLAATSASFVESVLEVEDWDF